MELGIIHYRINEINMHGTPLSQRSGFIWINGEFIEWGNAKIHILTHSLHYASSVFEGERAYNGKVFRLGAHTNRLLTSAAVMGLDVGFSKKEIEIATEKLLVLNNIQNCYVRPLIWKGSESQRLVSSDATSNIMIACFPMSERARVKKIMLSKWIKPHPQALPPQCKSSGSYQTMILALNEAQEHGYNGALLLDYRGFIAECDTSNIFFVRDNKLVTPSTDCILNGITRMTIIEIANILNIAVEERDILPTELPMFSEAFATGTAIEVMPIQSIHHHGNDIVYSNSNITPQIIKAYSQMVIKTYNE